MFPTLACGLLMLAVAVKYAVAPDKRFVPLLTGLGILTLSSGALGFVTGLITTCGAIGSDRIPVGQDTHIAIIGLGESLNDIAFALIFSVLAAMCASYGAWRLSRMATAGADARA
jgi:ABC-type antimicrobial peptide transport system permease subunit